MTMSEALKEYLETHGIEYELVSHPRALSSNEAAEAAHVPGDLLAKTVVVEDGEAHVGVVVPATKQVDLAAVSAALGEQCGLAAEPRIENIFGDCETGSIPAVPQAFGLDVLVDESLKGLDEVYFPAGVHTRLARLAGEDFEALMSDATVGTFVETWE